MVKNFWSEYSQESHIRRAEFVFVLLWNSTLRNMGYKCKTIPRNLTLISIATAFAQVLSSFVSVGSREKIKRESMYLLGFLKSESQPNVSSHTAENIDVPE
jgi:hypothetical protein